MNYSRLFHLMLSLALTASLLSGCTNQGCTDPLSLTYDADAVEDDGTCTYPIPTLSIETVVGSESFVPGQVYSIGGTAVEFSDIAYYISAPAFGADGQFTTTDTTLYVKAGTDQSFELAAYEGSHMHMIRFAIGVDSLTNFEDGDPTRFDVEHPLGPKSPNMYWNWAAGYIFFRVDGQVDTDNDGTPDAAMEFHLGTQKFFQMTMFEVHTDADQASVPVTLSLNVEDLFTGIDLSTEYISHTGDFPELATRFAANIPGSFSKK